MKFVKMWIGFTALSFCVLSAGYFYLSGAGTDKVNIAAEMNDAELLPVATHTVEHGTFQDITTAQQRAPFIVQYSSQFANGTSVVKTILANEMPYLTRTGHYVIYQYFRADGTVDHDRLVEPEVHVGASIWEKYRDRYFDNRNNEIQERYIRADGTLGCLFDKVTGNVTSYFDDGTTVRTQQTYTKGKGKELNLTEVRFRKDGKIWWSTNYTTWRTHVYFDLDGKPFNKEFTQEYPDNNGHGFNMGQNDSPQLLRHDKYWRSDGTLEYMQTWYLMYDKSDGRFKDVLGDVTVYDTSGKNELATYYLNKRAQGQPRFIEEAIIHDPKSNTTIDRKYSAPNHRAMETLLSVEDGVVVGRPRQHSANEFFQEPVDDHFFQGFNHDLWGNPDANPHDI